MKKIISFVGIDTKGIINIISVTLIASLIITVGFVSFEPERTIAATATDSVVVTLNVTAGISITAPADSSMSTALGIASNTAIGSTVWNVKTNNHLGYTLAVKSTGVPSAVPAMQASSTAVILDYQTGAPNAWSVAPGNAFFGYSAFGTDVTTVGGWGSGASCGAGNVPSATLFYKGFTASDTIIARHNATTTPAGIDSTVCYAVEQDNYYISSGVYTANITATAVTL